MHHAAPLKVREIRLAQPQPGPANPVDGADRTATSAQQFERGVQGRISCRPWVHHGDTIPIRGYPSGQSQLY
jgi:hypothetical protein